MDLERLTPEQLTRLERWLSQYPDLETLDALLLERLEEAEGAGRSRLDSGKLSRELGVAHALVRRAVSSLDVRGLITTASRSGASPGLWLSLTAHDDDRRGAE